MSGLVVSSWVGLGWIEKKKKKNPTPTPPARNQSIDSIHPIPSHPIPSLIIINKPKTGINTEKHVEEKRRHVCSVK